MRKNVSEPGSDVIMSLKFAEIGRIGDIYYVTEKDPSSGMITHHREYTGDDAGGAARANFCDQIYTVIWKYIGKYLEKHGYDPITGRRKIKNEINSNTTEEQDP